MTDWQPQVIPVGKWLLEIATMQTMGNHGNLIVGRTNARRYLVPFDASLWIISLSNFLLSS